MFVKFLKTAASIVVLVIVAMVSIGVVTFVSDRPYPWRWDAPDSMLADFETRIEGVSEELRRRFPQQMEQYQHAALACEDNHCTDAVSLQATREAIRIWKESDILDRLLNFKDWGDRKNSAHDRDKFFELYASREKSKERLRQECEPSIQFYWSNTGGDFVEQSEIICN